jgi:drug/metabolite transporter (DMT)-like permease
MIGFAVILVGSLCLAAQNVLLRVMFSESLVFGQVWGGFLPSTVSNSVLVLQIRSVLILPAMLLLAPLFYPGTQTALRQLVTPSQRSLLWRSVVSSTFLFLSLSFLFIAIATIPAGMATVLFFTHPVITGLVAWRLFGDRPSVLRLTMTATVLIGSVLVVPTAGTLNPDQLWLGIGAALGACVTYSAQGVLAQTCFRTIHPVPFTVVNFIVMAVLSTVSLLFINIDVPGDAWGPLWLLSSLASALTLVGQLLYNIGIHLVSAALMAIVAVSNPVSTTLMAWIFLQETLSLRQSLGVGLVVLSIAILGYEKTRMQPKV